MLFWMFFRQHVYRSDEGLPAGRRRSRSHKAETHPWPGPVLFQSVWQAGARAAFFTLSLVSIQQRRSFPIHIEQVVRNDAEKAASKAKADAKKQGPSTAQRRPGRPKG